MKKSIALVLALVFIMISMCGCNNESVSSLSSESTDGSESTVDYKVPESYEGPKLIATTVPTDAPNLSPDFAVKANGEEVGVYSDVNCWNGKVNFAYFDIADDFQADVTVNVNFSFESVKIYPENLGIVPERSNNELKFKVNEPNQKLTFVFDEDYKGTVLHLFVNRIDYDAPKEGEAGVTYFGAGFHNLKDMYPNGIIPVGNGRTIYIAPGAVVLGGIQITDVKNVSVKGSGVILMNYEDNPQKCITVNQSSNILIEGVISSMQTSPAWVTHIHYSTDVTIENYKVIAPHYASTDGIDISNSSSVSVSNSFIRSCDDCIAIKGLGSDKAAPGDAVANDNIHISKCVLWNDCNCSMVLGAETRASKYSNISFKDIDVIFSYDDKDHHERLSERAVMNIICLWSTYFEDITWENIRVNMGERLVGISFQPSFWFGTLKGDLSHPGHIKNVTYKNITSNNNSGSRISNEIMLYGWNKDLGISNITFDNVVIEGKKIKNDNEFLMDTYVSELKFK